MSGPPEIRKFDAKIRRASAPAYFSLCGLPFPFQWANLIILLKFKNRMTYADLCCFSPDPVLFLNPKG